MFSVTGIKNRECRKNINEYCLLQFDEFIVYVLQDALEFDGLVSSHPIYVPVNNPDEINEIFDTISYSKVQNCGFQT